MPCNEVLDLFNIFNHANRENPISDINANDFGNVVSFSSSPRVVQLSVKFEFWLQAKLCNPANVLPQSQLRCSESERTCWD